VNAYRRYERRALEEAIQIYPEAVIATPGGLVSDPATFNQLLAHCTTVWLQADPEDHMGRVLAQGDLRPMAPAARPWRTSRASWPGARPSIRRPISARHQCPAAGRDLLALRKIVRTALQLPPEHRKRCIKSA
jgi:XRE family aerobic/anaerobic benzoate catabolism transcriptional regulator